MPKILALDIGDEWTGIALSDALHISAKPYKTVATKELTKQLTTIIGQESIQEIVVGHPITLRGTTSEQTKKIVTFKERLEKEFPTISWVLWDERLSSKRAETLSPAKTKEQKLHAHAVAAAFILQSYLDYLDYKK